MQNQLTERQNQIGRELYDIAFKLHRFLGPELLESVYEKCFCYELASRNINFSRQVLVPIQYENQLSSGMGGSIIKLSKTNKPATRIFNQLSYTFNKRWNKTHGALTS